MHGIQATLWRISMPSLVYQILMKKSIVEYLESRGHQPYKILSGGKLQYLCPFPDHEETKPSFVVFTNAEYENFYCFGCSQKHNIIHLVAGLEGISFRQAVEKLSDGMKIDLQENIELEIERISKNIIQGPEKLKLDEKLLSVSSLCFNYLLGVDNDPTECDAIDKLLASVDTDLLNCEFDSIDDTFVNLGSALNKRRKIFEKKKIQELREKYVDPSS